MSTADPGSDERHPESGMSAEAAEGEPAAGRPVAFRTTRRVEFRDTDAAGIAHFSAFFPMMESAEHEFLRSLGLSVMPSADVADRLTWPRVAAACDFQGPARFEDLLQIDVRVDRVGRSSVTYRFQITTEGRPVATGRMTAVCCRLAEGGHLTKADVPHDIRSQLLRAIA